jgi:hypothetical protein
LREDYSGSGGGGQANPPVWRPSWPKSPADGHFTEEKIVTFKNFAGQYAFLLWQTGRASYTNRRTARDFPVVDIPVV